MLAGADNDINQLTHCFPVVVMEFTCTLIAERVHTRITHLAIFLVSSNSQKTLACSLCEMTQVNSQC